MRLLFVSMGLLVSGAGHAAQTVASSYDCIGEAATSIAWDKGDKPEVESEVKKTSQTVKLIDLNSNNPKIAGQSVAGLLKVSDTPRETYFMEKTSNGNIYLWVLFKEKKGGARVLVSLKAYELLGTATFTQAYSCKENL